MAVYLGNKKVSVKGGYTSGGGGGTSYPLSTFLRAGGKFAHTTYTDTELTNIIKPDDTKNIQDFTHMFEGCTNLTTIPQLNTSNASSMNSMFFGCTNLTTIPLIDTTYVGNMDEMFYGCHNLKVVPALVCSNQTSLTNMFYGCYNLEEIHMTGMERTFRVDDCTKLTREALVELLNNLGTPRSTRSLYLGSENLAKLTEEDKAIATNKNWRLR